MLVSVQLKNPPLGGEQWYLYLYNWSNTDYRSKIDVPVSEAISFDIPETWDWPLRFYIYVYKAVTREGIAAYQSWDPTFAGYIEVYIPSAGSYYFNCATMQFELISAGRVADITKIEAPSSALAGESVIVDVSIKNISSLDKYLSVIAVFDSTSIPFQFDYLLVSPSQAVIFRGNFTMPNKGVRITAWGRYWDGSKWVFDDTMTFNIALAVLTPEFAGFAITEYN